jgi:two-component system response regulator HydG
MGLTIDSNHGAQILIVDDDDNLRMIVTDRLESMGYGVTSVSSFASAVVEMGERQYPLVLLDIYLPDQEGLDGLRRIKELHPSTVVIVLTAHGTIDLAVEAMKHGAYDFVTKPLDFKRLGVLVQRALENTQLRTEIDYLRRALDEPYSEIIGDDRGLKFVMDLVRRVAPSDTTVLIRGETGSGKEVIARAIHRLSSRAQKLMVVANCAAIPHDLMESEMFGHVRGAFTGAVSDHAGFFEAAGTGTLLLDEIGDLDLDLQAKILRVLEDGQFRRVGGSSNLVNRARVIASTHQPLESLMEQGRFREDLYYRLNVLPIHLPPLRERREDIPEMAHEFLRKACRGRRPDIPALDATTVEALCAHPWWGNVRELRNCMERLALTVPRARIRLEDVQPLLVRRPMRKGEPRVQPLKSLETQAIREALARYDGNRTKAASALGIGRRTLQNKLKSLGISNDA